MECEGQHISSTFNVNSINLDKTKNNDEQKQVIESFQNFFVDKFENISGDILVENLAPYIILKTNSIDGPIKLLMDTGASVSIISSRFISPNTELQNFRCKLFGLSSNGEGILSMGILHTNTIINGVSLGLSLNVIDQKCLGSIDGILGFDFLLNYGAIIDMENFKVHFKLNDIISEKPKQNENEENELQIKNNNEKIMNEFRALMESVDKESLNKIKQEIFNSFTYAFDPEHECENIEDDNKTLDNVLPEPNIINIETIPKSNDDFDDYMEATYFYSSEWEKSEQLKINSGINSVRLSPLSNYNSLKQQQNMNFELKEPTAQGIFHFNQSANDGEKIKNLNDRKKFIFDKLKRDHCRDSELEHIKKICEDYSYQFFVEGDNLGCTDVIEHHIKLNPDSKVVNTKQYRIPHSHREILRQIVNDYENQGIIEKCQSNYNSPAILVPKKDENNGTTDFRFVVDFRKVNENSQLSNFPIPHIDDIFDGLGGCKFFSTLDIKGAFHQIVLNINSRDYTAFTVGSFQYRWVRMPMGLSEAPLTWQRAINTILADVIGKGVYIYLDDVIIYSKTAEEHNKILFQVLDLLKQHNLQLKISKCIFYAKNFEYLGFIISESGISANPKKIEIIQKFPIPKNVKQVQSFLGILNYYRRFVRDFAKIAKPLTMLCKQDLPFIWTMNTQTAFDSLKRILIGDVVLKFPNFEETFYVTTDASDVAIGGVLSQGELPNDRPIFFFSKTLTDCQRRYSTIQKELLAIVECIKAFRVYLYGRFFILITDHKPLCYLFNMKDCGSRLFRQRLDILDYNFKILHRPGAQNLVADALSRVEPISIQEALEIENKKSQINALTRAQAKQNLDSSQKHFSLDERDGTILNRRGFDLLFHLIPLENDHLKNKLINKFGIANFSSQWNSFCHFHFAKVISNQFSHMNYISETNKCISDILDISQKKHVESIAINIDFDSIRHFIHLKDTLNEIFKNSNISVTLFLNKIVEVIEKSDIEAILDLYHKSLLGGHFGIEKMLKTISKFYKWNNMSIDIKNYVSKCEICQKTKVTTNTKIPMQISSLGEVLFDHTYIDFVGPISPVSSDGHKYIFTATCDLTKFMIAVPTRDCSAVTTANCLLKHVLLKYNFPSRLISDNASNFNSKVIHELSKTLQVKKIFTTPYHPQSNIVERGHRTLNSYLRAFSSKNKDEWHLLLKFAMFAYNNSIHSTTGFTPHELAHGFKIQIPNHLFKSKTIYNYDNLADMVRNNIANALELAKKHLITQKMINKQYYDKNAKNLDIQVGDKILLKTQNKTDKFQHIYDGPYEVLTANNDYVEIKRNNSRVKVHKNLIKKLNDDTFPSVDLNDANLVSLFQF